MGCLGELRHLLSLYLPFKISPCFRKMTDLNEVFAQVCNHIIYSTNEGNIKPALTVFPERVPGQPDKVCLYLLLTCSCSFMFFVHIKVRIWNGQIIMFAGYEQEDGSVIGDPINKEFTAVNTLLQGDK